MACMSQSGVLNLPCSRPCKDWLLTCHLLLAGAQGALFAIVSRCMAKLLAGLHLGRANRHPWCFIVPQQHLHCLSELFFASSSSAVHCGRADAGSAAVTLTGEGGGGGGLDAGEG